MGLSKIWETQSEERQLPGPGGSPLSQGPLWSGQSTSKPPSSHPLVTGMMWGQEFEVMASAY